MKLKQTVLLTIGAGILLQGCASGGPVTDDTTQKRIVTDSSSRGTEAPGWVTSGKEIWEDGSDIIRRGFSTVLGHQRLSGCYALAKVEAKAGLLTEIQEEMKGLLDSGETGLSEDVETAFNRATTSSFAGKVQGLQIRESYYERYVVGGKERIDCYVLTAIKKSDYQTLRRSIINAVAEVDPRLKELAVQKQISLFNVEGRSEEKAANPRVPPTTQHKAAGEATNGTSQNEKIVVGTDGPDT